MPMTPKENKNPVGRPVLYKTKEELKFIIDEYFDYCDNRLVKGYDNKTNTEFAYISPAPYTMSGLARRLGMSRETLVQYGHKDEFSDTITCAREKVQEDIEIRLMETRNEKGAIFNLSNNFGWKNKTETDLNLDAKDLEINFKRSK
jgi:hypothetical protein